MIARLIASFLLLQACSGNSNPFSGQSEQEWISISETTQFQPASSTSLRKAQKRFLSGYADGFVDGSETLYEEYAQAWRVLGLYVDCNTDAGLRRNLGDNDSQCQRYIMWAAYVDLEYDGGGIGEYQFFDPSTNEWDTSACELKNNERCAKMDCHEPVSYSID
jgi:hypothetical protein